MTTAYVHINVFIFFFILQFLYNIIFLVKINGTKIKKPKPQLSQIKLMIELVNELGSGSTTTTHPTSPTQWTETWHADSLDGIERA